MEFKSYANNYISFPLQTQSGAIELVTLYYNYYLYFQIYLKTRLNCLLMRHSVSDVSKPEAPKPLENKKDALELDEEEEHIWESMAVVSDKSRKKKIFGIHSDKNKRQKIEVSCASF